MGKYTTSCYAYMYKACYNVARSENCTRLQTRAHDNCSCSCETGLVKPNATILKVCLIWALSERHHVEAVSLLVESPALRRDMKRYIGVQE